MTRRRAIRGYVLLEAIVALTVMSVGLVALMQAFRTSLEASTRAEHLLAATALAERRIGELRCEPGPAAGTREGDFGPDHAGYAWRQTIAAVGREPCYSVLVEVWWNESGQRRSVALATLIPSDGPH